MSPVPKPKVKRAKSQTPITSSSQRPNNYISSKSP